MSSRTKKRIAHDSIQPNVEALKNKTDENKRLVLKKQILSLENRDKDKKPVFIPEIRATIYVKKSVDSKIAKEMYLTKIGVK